MEVSVLPFKSLSLTDLYEIISLRIAVFIVEQNCPYQELDGKDLYSHHLIIKTKDSNLIVGTARIIPNNESTDYISIGRVASHPEFRQSKIGHLIMESCLKFIEKEYASVRIKISAQSHLVPFYSQYNFVSTGKEYLEDNIPHTEMIRTN